MYKRAESKFCSDNCRYKMHAAGSSRKRIPDDLRWDILRRDTFACVTCGFAPPDGAELRVDHITPVQEGGALTAPDNLITLCQRCNSGKGAKLIDPFLLPPSREGEVETEPAGAHELSRLILHYAEVTPTGEADALELAALIINECGLVDA